MNEGAYEEKMSVDWQNWKDLVKGTDKNGKEGEREVRKFTVRR